MFARASLSSLARVGRRNMGSYHPPASWRAPTMNDLATPKGSWEAAYKAQNSKYNILLVASLVFCVASWTYVNSSPYVIWNWGPSMSGPLNVPTDAEIIADLAKRKAEQADE